MTTDRMREISVTNRHPRLKLDRRALVRAIHHLDEARAIRSAGVRLRHVRRAGELLGDSLREGPKVVAVRTLRSAR